MQKKIKFIVVGIIGISCFMTLFMLNLYIFPNLDFTSSNNLNNEENNESLDNVVNVTVKIYYGGVKSSKIIENITLTDGETTAFYATDKVCEIDGYGFPDNAYIQEIDGVRENVDKSNYFWIYYINGEEAQIGCSAYNLEDGDEVMWIYQERY